MWFIYFWIISTLICIVINKIAGELCEKELKAEGYDISKIKSSATDKMKACTILILPLINIVIILVLLLNPESIKAEVIERYGLTKMIR